MQHSSSTDRITLAGLLVSMGIVFGDIGTSPLYAMQATVGHRTVSFELALGALSAIFWTLTIQTTIKYVIITLRADNNGEGGIFSLFALVRRYKGWFLFPAILGGGFLLADGIITPPISVASAVEGLLVLYPDMSTVPIVLGIIVVFFTVQQMGTDFIGKFFGPIMLAWFTSIGIIGLLYALRNPGVLAAINPWYAYNMIVNFPEGFWLLGGVFLCTTGAEALYSDMGHCGRGNIRLSWMYVKICLLLSYAGQASWLLEHIGQNVAEQRTFYAIVPQVLLVPMILLATASAVVASQAMISGAYTLVSEAMRLECWPKFKVVYPSHFKGQLYIPRINWLFMVGSIGVVLYFKKASNMEAAYGLAVTLTMMMTTILLGAYLRTKRVPVIFVAMICGVFFSVETGFLVANMMKFPEGGYISFGIGFLLLTVMYIWHKGVTFKREMVQFDSMTKNLPTLRALSNDESVAKVATHLVYLTASPTIDRIESRILYSITQRTPKRADVYWFVHVNVLDEPFAMRYKVDVLAEEDVIWVTFNLGFRIEPRINFFFRLVVEDMARNHEIDIRSRYSSLGNYNVAGDFKFVLLSTFLSYENELPAWRKLTLNTYFWLKEFSLSDEAAYGLDTSNVTVEKIPMVISPPRDFRLIRET